jgi:EAL domain-containing protein (putative c-di-GMP-specific phosphodiesterase class I)/GGDEF domain-containing protein
VLLRDHAAMESIATLVQANGLVSHFQPIVRLSQAEVLGYEALARGPSGCPLEMPDAMFAAARREGISTRFEMDCMRVALAGWSAAGADGRLFLNMSSGALIAAFSEGCLDAALARVECAGFDCTTLVIELTEHEQVGDLPALCAAVELLRLRGMKLALDDFGDGRSSLRLWSELHPDYVKIDKYFAKGLAHDGAKLQTYRALLQLADTLGAALVAEGIETAEDLRVLRDLGVAYGQGWLLGRPAALPQSAPADIAVEVLRAGGIAIFPELRHAARHALTAARLAIEAPTVSPRTTNDEIYRLIDRHPALHAIAVVDEGRPIGLISCQQFVNHYARPFFRELYGRRRCLHLANRAPLLIDIHTGLEELTAVLTASDQRYLSEGFILTANERYWALGTGESLVRAVTEARIEAARHANPLTFLPGNIPIQQHTQRLLRSGTAFTAAYADLTNFKSFNDFYGYWRGDTMIRLLARILSSHCDPGCDFLGHIGGDDFVLLFQSADWLQRCERSVADLNRLALDLFDQPARQAGGIEAEDRHGVMRFNPCTTLTIGAVSVEPGRLYGAEEVAAAAVNAKRVARQRGLGVLALEATGTNSAAATRAVLQIAG